MNSKSNKTIEERSWHIATRWQEFDGEMRAALLRGIFVITFYSVQLIHQIGLKDPSQLSQQFHRQVTIVAGAWLFVSLAVWIALRGYFMPPILKYVTTTFDVGLLSIIAFLGSGPQSPLVFVYFVVIALAAIRFRLLLVWYTTILCMTCYLVLVASVDQSWFDSEHQTPVITQAVILLSLASIGIVLGQMIRSTRSMAAEYENRLSNHKLGGEK